MANMSYCRFENTSNDFRDCLGAMEEAETLDEMQLNEYEARSMRNMAKMSEEYLEHYTRLTEK